MYYSGAMLMYRSRKNGKKSSAGISKMAESLDVFWQASGVMIQSKSQG